MLSEKEKTGITNILHKINDSTLQSLAFTTTKGLIKPETRFEAIKIIVSYSESPYTFLKRKKLKKEYIFNYLKEENILPSVSAEKWELIKVCLKHWNSDIPQVEEVNDDSVDIEEISLGCESSSVSLVTNSSVFATAVTSLSSTKIATFNSSSTPQQPNSFHPSFQGLNTAGVSPQPSSTQNSDDLLNNMGRKFAEWFYCLLNKVQTTSVDFGPQHFWPDCILKVFIHQGNEVMNINVSNAEDVSRYFIQLVNSENLFFHPNCCYGTNCETEIHGLVKIQVSGLIHKEDNCIGLFDQLFGLIRSAGSENNWKIKYSELMLRLKQTKSQITT